MASVSTCSLAMSFTRRATSERSTLSLHDALPILVGLGDVERAVGPDVDGDVQPVDDVAARRRRGGGQEEQRDEGEEEGRQGARQTVHARQRYPESGRPRPTAAGPLGRSAAAAPAPAPTTAGEAAPAAARARAPGGARGGGQRAAGPWGDATGASTRGRRVTPRHVGPAVAPPVRPPRAVR